MSTDTATLCEDQLTDGTDQVRAIVERTNSVYSLPAVAAEVIQLTGNPQVDVQALKECIENDPALTAKLLRVVNSSLFGLSREVSDLNQALALLGVKPLKLLVLGFSLPEELFAQVAREQLAWYWKRSLVRAVTAREISQRYWQKPGDDAFLAGLLEDIGVLVLLDQLREPYARFLSHVIEGNSALTGLELQTLGFDHRELTAALLKDWNLPSLMVKAIGEERSIESLSSGKGEIKELARILHLASLMAELVGQNRLQVLPELLAAGKAYCGFDKEKLHEIVPELQTKVGQLAEVLSLDLPNDSSYLDVVNEAHQQMALLSEEVAAPLSHLERVELGHTTELPVESGELRAAVSDLVNRPLAPVTNTEAEATEATSTASAASPESRQSTNPAPEPSRQRQEPLTLAVGMCRSRRAPLSLLLVSCDVRLAATPTEQERLHQIIEFACRSVEWDHAQCERVGKERWQVILPECDRHHAVRLAHEAFLVIQENLERMGGDFTSALSSLSAGVACVSLPPRNFHPPDMIDAAQRCLYAAEISDANVVKSIEIF